MGLRLLLAIGVIEAMPDQELFAVIHPGPPKLRWPKCDRLRELRAQVWPFCRGWMCQHLNRSSPVLAIMAAIFGGDRTNPQQYTEWLVGWVCYGLAITQYLIIGLVTSRDKALDALSAFDRQVARRRRELIEEFGIPVRSPPADSSENASALLSGTDLGVPEQTGDESGPPSVAKAGQTIQNPTDGRL